MQIGARTRVCIGVPWHARTYTYTFTVLPLGSELVHMHSTRVKVARPTSTTLLSYHVTARTRPRRVQRRNGSLYITNDYLVPW